MKILLYSHEFLPFAGGIATYCYELACGLSLRGHDVKILAEKNGSVDLSTERFSVEWITPDDAPAATMLRSARHFFRVTRRFQPAVILVNDRVSLRVASICRYLGGRGATVIPVVHGVGSSHIRTRASRGILESLFGWQLKSFFRSRRLVICVSSHMRRVYIDSRFASRLQRVAVVYNGVESGFDRRVHDGQSVRQRWSISSSTTVLLTIARLAPNKGQDVVIRALPRVIREHPNVVYICAGTGEYEETLTALAVEHGVAQHVIFPGQIPNDHSKYLYYDACDLFVMPSRFEAFGLSFVEAWHAAKPVLGGNRGGPAEIIEDGVDGVVVEATDVVDVANSIAELIRDPARLREMGRRGMIKAHREFSRSVMADTLVGVLGDSGVAAK